jgi:hypothetical protein
MARAAPSSNRRFLAAGRRCRVVVLQRDDKRGLVQGILSLPGSELLDPTLSMSANVLLRLRTSDVAAIK